MLDPNKAMKISKKEYKVFRQIFKAKDKDCSGGLAYSEFLKACQAYGELPPMPPMAVTSLFEKLDCDDDGEISLPELLMAYYPRCTRAEVDQFIAKYDNHETIAKPLTEEQEEELETIMSLVDKNSDGWIDRDELTFFCSNLGLEDDTVDRWLAKYGSPQCITLTKREFRQLFADVFLRDLTTELQFSNALRACKSD
eukprot:TRINITY_DN1682_c0_g1_i1.p1 TRINITY_DN1682_c0_g1~~TRINITY_DN1682_c0_g1_i1.p1  ORF type:complete len:197 (+),score=50.21 TRINITY_DN1682_c0_g1_i1:191-781(+)